MPTKSDNDLNNLILSLTRKDFEVRTFRVPGKGGQKVNKTSSGVEIIHRASGASGKCTETRSQHKNKQIALKRLTETPAFKAWLAATTRNLKTPLEIEKEVKESISDPKNIKTEIHVRKDEWKEVNPNELS